MVQTNSSAPIIVPQSPSAADAELNLHTSHRHNQQTHRHTTHLELDPNHSVSRLVVIPVVRHSSIGTRPITLRINSSQTIRSMQREPLKAIRQNETHTTSCNQVPQVGSKPSENLTKLFRFLSSKDTNNRSSSRSPPPPPFMVEITPENVMYRAEGNATLVVALTKEEKVLKLIKGHRKDLVSLRLYL